MFVSCTAVINIKVKFGDCGDIKGCLHIEKASFPRSEKIQSIHDESMKTPAAATAITFNSTFSTTSKPNQISSIPSNNCTTQDQHALYFEACTKAARTIISKEVYSGYTELLHINAAVRNLFLANFASIFQDYENFLVLDKSFGENSGDNCENICSGLQVFDKVGFLSDQPETHLPFLSAFLETQMFASFLDSRINWNNLFNSLSDSQAIQFTNSPPMHLTVFHLLLSKSRNDRKAIFCHHAGDSDRSTTTTTTTTTTTMDTTGSPDNNFYNYVLGYQQKQCRTTDSHFPDFNSQPIFDNFNNRINDEPLPDLLYDIKTELNVNKTNHQLLYMLPYNSSSVTPTTNDGIVQYGKFPTLSSELLRFYSPDSQMMIADSHQQNITPNCQQLFSNIKHSIRNDSYKLQNNNNSLAHRKCTTVSGNHFHSAPQSDKIGRHISLPASSGVISPPNRLNNQIGCMSTPTKRVAPLSSIINTMNTDVLHNLNKPDTKNSIIPSGNNGKSTTNRSFIHTHHQFADLQRNGMAQANWDFVDALLEECKHRTKRMVLKKIGQEAIEMGHVDPNISVVEENTLVSGLCDLMERIWSHGLNRKLGKSALCSSPRISDLRNRSVGSISSRISDSAETNQEISRVDPKYSGYSSLKRVRKFSRDTAESNPSVAKISQSSYRSARFPWQDPYYPSSSSSSALSTAFPPKLSTNLTNWKMKLQMLDVRGSSNRAHSASSRQKDYSSNSSHVGQSSNANTGSGAFTTTEASGAGMILDLRKIFGPQFTEHSLIADIHSIQSMKSVKTDIGFARAFVRLALEKKLLSAHLTRLLMDTKLLRHMYTRYAFLRCEEEREQFLVHLLSLNAVDYFSFTRMINQN
ncbi:unnamed protein product [Heterobilharzia americana]|nr:unnamed protein product [Heterobilharzia americana]